LGIDRRLGPWCNRVWAAGALIIVQRVTGWRAIPSINIARLGSPWLFRVARITTSRALRQFFLRPTIHIHRWLVRKVRLLDVPFNAAFDPFRRIPNPIVRECGPRFGGPTRRFDA
jgi:hypothetical protein